MPPTLRRVATGELTAQELARLRSFLVEAFGDDPDEALRDEDWEHTLGGIHVIATEGGSILAHAAVVERTIHVGDRPLSTGYVEAVATRGDRRREGLGRAVMTEAAAIIRDGFELGMLGTGLQPFYERLGWRVWRGPSAIRTEAGLVPSPDEDGYLMVLDTPTTPALDPLAPIACGWRPGDSW
jgi:aminoglycoside 2'-N-acetyltransferase I